jgi:hypothetical protein
MTRTTALSLCAALALGLALPACGDSKSGGSGAPGGGGQAATGGTPAPTADAGSGGATGGTPDHPDLGVVESGMERRAGRMRIEQIKRSIEVVTGGLTWEEDFGNGPTRMLDALGPTMGEPDYLLVTEENMEPSLIVAKFMQDASHRICTKWVAAEVERPAAERTLVRHAGAFDSRDAADVKSALRTLNLRFFAHYLPEDGSKDAEMAPLVELFDTAANTSVPGREARDGWLAVCIALMTDPEMVVY